MMRLCLGSAAQQALWVLQTSPPSGDIVAAAALASRHQICNALSSHWYGFLPPKMFQNGSVVIPHTTSNIIKVNQSTIDLPIPLEFGHLRRSLRRVCACCHGETGQPKQHNKDNTVWLPAQNNAAMLVFVHAEMRVWTEIDMEVW